MSRLRLVAPALAAIALAASGCGKSASTTTSAQTASSAQSNSSTTTTTTTTLAGATKPLTRAELIAKADLICKRVNARHAATSFDTKGDYARLLPPLAAYQLAAAAAMRKLTPPPSMAAGWQQIVNDAQTFAEDVAKLGQYAVANKLRAGRAVSLAGAKADEQMLAIALREGFQDCAHATG